jgi:iduronate 2-sulfatase
MNRRLFLGSSLAGFSILKGAKKPMNVLFIVSDDLTSTALGCYGHKLVKSPNVDGIARQGMRFDAANCQYPLCAPSRASFLTGMRPDKTKVITNGPDFRDFVPNAVTLPQLFKNNGYEAIREGKMYHMGVPGTVGTDRWQDAASWSHNGSPQGKEHLSKGDLKNYTPHIAGAGVSMQVVKTPDEKEQADFDAANRAIAHIERLGDKPFFIGLGFVRPHVPMVAPGRFHDLYPLKDIKPFQNPADDFADMPPFIKRTNPNNWDNMKMDEDKQREALQGYYASISFMDEQLGRVLRVLEAKKLRENTIVTFQSDHGWGLGEHEHWQKQCLFEESAKVPLVVSVPGMKNRGKVYSHPVELVDVYPTIADYAGLTAPKELDGVSLRPALENPDRQVKPAAHTQLNTAVANGRAVRTRHFRYLHWKTPEGEVFEELYDRRKDPQEFRSVSKDPAYARDLEAHRKLLPA